VYPERHFEKRQIPSRLPVVAIFATRTNPLTKRIMPRLKLVLILLFALCTSAASATVVIEPEISMGSWPKWRVDGLVITVDLRCTISQAGYPSKQCSPPYVSISADVFDSPQKTRAILGASLSSDGVTISSNSMGSAWLSRENIELFNLLSQKSKPKATLKITKLNQVDGTGIDVSSPSTEKTETIVLSNFSELAAAHISEANRTYEDQFHRAKLSFIMKIVFLFGLFVVFVLVLWRVIKSISSKSKAVIEKAGAELEERRVRRIAEDEAIRVTVRKSVETAEEHEINAIKDRIKAALDSGDTETASTLLGILQKRSVQ